MRLIGIVLAVSMTAACSRDVPAPTPTPAPAAEVSDLPDELPEELPDDLSQPVEVPEPEPVDSHERMVATLAAISRQAAVDNPFFGSGRVAQLRARVEAAGAAPPWRLLLDTGLAELQLGEEREGIATLTRLRDGLRAGRIRGDFVANLSASFYLGVAWLRLAETENCCRQANADSCILPFAEAALHTESEGSKAAAQCFLVVLANTEPNDRFHLAARWLFNLAHMSLGSHPDGVPERFRLPASLFDPGAAERFRNVAIERGLASFSNSGGVVVDDLTGDDRFDILVSDWRPDGAIQLFVQQPDGAFVERSAAAGLTGITGGLNLLQADYDNDGDLDVLVLRGAWWFDHGRHPNSLLQNDGSGNFRDVTFDAGLAVVDYPTQTAGWADFDLDGDLDLYIGNEHSELAHAPSQLFENDGDGTFTDIAAAAGVTNLLGAKAVHWGDIDNDGDPDLYVSNRDGSNRLYRNDGDGTFTDVAKERGVTHPIEGFPAFFFDRDNDGDLDLFASNYNTGISHVTAHLVGAQLPYERPRLYDNDGSGRFTDVAKAQGLTYPSLPMGSNFGDLDNDGWLDLYLGTGDTDYETLLPNLAYRNDGGARFVDVTMATGLGHLQKGHGIAFADIDGDGDQDIFAEMGGAYPGDAYGNALFDNPGNGNHWLTVHLVGTTSNRCAIGARIRVVAREGGKDRSIWRDVNSGGTFGASPLRQAIGLGSADEVVRIEIRWPRPRGEAAADDLQIVEAPPLDATIRVVEGEDGFTRLP